MGNSATPPAPPAQKDLSECPIHKSNKTTEASAEHAKTDSSPECPVAPDTRKRYKNPKMYNVYSQEVKPNLNPDNNMPSKPAQQQNQDQRIPLDTSRVKSTIPKGGTDTATWEYPSPQMFWNAIVRKGKKGDTNEEDMDVVVAIHNNMNESTWAQVLAWEGLHPPPADVNGAEPKLLRFTGRPDENSPKSRLKQLLFGCPIPFDRHDWIVDRGGKEVRYIIDYYHDDDGVKADRVPGLHDFDKIQSIRVDVRPALDSVEAMIDRVMRMPFAVYKGTSDFVPLPLTMPKAPANPLDAVPALAEQQAKKHVPKEYMEIGERIQQKCERSLLRMQNCKDESDCRNAQIALTYCYAQIICPPQAEGFNNAMQDEAASEAGLETAFHTMRTCVQDFQQKVIEASSDIKK